VTSTQLSLALSPAHPGGSVCFFLFIWKAEGAHSHLQLCVYLPETCKLRTPCPVLSPGLPQVTLLWLAPDRTVTSAPIKGEFEPRLAR
jgi:hypothetical protein